MKRYRKLLNYRGNWRDATTATAIRSEIRGKFGNVARRLRILIHGARSAPKTDWAPWVKVRASWATFPKFPRILGRISDSIVAPYQLPHIEQRYVAPLHFVKPHGSKIEKVKISTRRAIGNRWCNSTGRYQSFLCYHMVLLQNEAAQQTAAI